MDGQSVEVTGANDGLSVVASLSEVSEQIDIAEDIPTDNDSNSDVFHHSEENTTTDHDVQASNVTLSFTSSQALHTTSYGTSGTLSPQTVHIEVTPAQAAVLSAIQQQHETGGSTTPTHVLVTTTTPLHNAGLQEGHSQIRIQGVQEQLSVHDLKHEDSEVESPSTPCSEGQLAEARSKWAESALSSDVLLVRCRNETAEFYKSKLGSGARGKCIKMGDQWYTPTEFEAYCGRASSKDWKRTIRYGRRTLQSLIDENVLMPHAISCTCASCCDDNTLAGPVRLFVPYKRRKRVSISGEPPLIKKRNMSVSSPLLEGQEAASATIMRSMSVDSAMHPQVNVLGVENCLASALQQRDLVVCTTSSVSTSVPVTSTQLRTTLPEVIVTNSVQQGENIFDRRQWWHMEELKPAMTNMVNSLMSTAQQIKAMIEQAKLQSEAAKDAAVAQAKLQAEAEKKEALAESHMKSLMQLSKALMDARAEKEAAVAQALAQAKADKMEAVAEARTQQFLKETSTLGINHEGENEL